MIRFFVAVDELVMTDQPRKTRMTRKVHSVFLRVRCISWLYSQRLFSGRFVRIVVWGSIYFRVVRVFRGQHNACSTKCVNHRRYCSRFINSSPKHVGQPVAIQFNISFGLPLNLTSRREIRLPTRRSVQKVTKQTGKT